MNKEQIEDIYPLSPMQQGMLFHTLYSPESGLYFEQITCVLRGPLDVPAFERAWQQAVDRHPALRTLLAWERRDPPLQIVLKPGQVTIRFEQQDWRGLGDADRAERVAAYLEIDRARGFRLSRAPLMRLALMRLADEAYQVVWSRHHIMLDGWSAGIVLKDVFAEYSAACAGVAATLEPVRPYRDYIAWLQTQALLTAETYWRRALAGVTAPAALPVDQGPGQGDLRSYASLEQHLSTGLSNQLVDFARRHKLTLNTLLQGALALLIFH
jgi:hypothetical protein